MLATFDTTQLGGLGYEYASRTRFGASTLPVPQNLTEAKQQMKLHEDDVKLSLLEREHAREVDIMEAEKVASQPVDDETKSIDTDEEVEVDNKDPNKTKWVSTCI